MEDLVKEVRRRAPSTEAELLETCVRVCLFRGFEPIAIKVVAAELLKQSRLELAL